MSPLFIAVAFANDNVIVLLVPAGKSVSLFQEDKLSKQAVIDKSGTDFLKDVSTLLCSKTSELYEEASSLAKGSDPLPSSPPWRI